MKERPILFNALMVKAILEGRKTQTRRLLKVQPPVADKKIIPLYQVEPVPKVTEVAFHEVLENNIPHCSSISRCKCPFGKIGDRLWVRETFMDLSGTGVEHRDLNGKLQRYAYGENCPRGSYSDELRKDFGLKWKPSIHMPRSACRLVLEITNIRVEQLQDISESDCLKEGVGSPILRDCKKPKFMQLWESINGTGSWNKNPWVWVVEFKVIQGGAA